jgi:hypothetical protein
MARIVPCLAPTLTRKCAISTKEDVIFLVTDFTCCFVPSDFKFKRKLWFFILCFNVDETDVFLRPLSHLFSRRLEVPNLCPVWEHSFFH